MPIHNMYIMKGVFIMDTKQYLSAAAACVLSASVCFNCLAADNDGWTQADLTDAAANGAWENWTEKWEEEKDNREIISLTPGSTESELNFAWYSKADADVPELWFWEKGSEEQKVDVAQTDAVPGYKSNKATVTGLEAGKTYCYRYTDGNGTSSDVIEYTAKPSDEFSFVFFGDPQIGSSAENIPQGSDEEQGQDNSVRNDSFNWNNTINKALELNPNVSFMVSAGDQIQSSDKKTADDTHAVYAENEIEYTGYLLPDALKSLPVATSIGNHDSLSSNYTYHFNNPNADELGSTYAGGDYYFSYGDALFIMLNTNNTNISEHKQFIEKADEAVSGAKWKIVTLHQDIYGSGEHSNEPEIAELRYGLTPIFEEYGIDTVLTGHDHTYNRSYIMKNAEISKYDWDMKAISDDEFSWNTEGVKENENGDEVPYEPTPEEAARYDSYLEMIEDKDYINSTDTETVVNPEGILYLTANSASGSKYYDLVDHQQAYIADRWQDDIPTFSIIDITDDSLTVNSYRTDDLSKIDSTFTIIKNDEKQLPYTINKAVFKTTENGEELSDIPESGSFIAELSITKNTETDGKDYIVTAAYKEDGSLAGINYSYADIPAESSYTIGMHVEQPESGSIAEVKSYIWDSLNGMTPLSSDTAY